MRNRYKCRRCWKTSETSKKCCRVPMSRASVHEGILWPFIPLRTEGKAA